MKVLVLGSGGREHAICWALNNSPLVDVVVCCPGNAGISEFAICHDIDYDNLDIVMSECLSHEIDLVVVGPEVPLVNGIVDQFEAEGIKVLGPTFAAAILEDSKIFTKDFCMRHGIMTSTYVKAYSAKEAKKLIEIFGAPIVIKDDGLAAGKGVIIADTLEEAFDGVDTLVDELNTQKFVLERKLEGVEVSFFALCDGKTAIPFGTAQDYKRVDEGDTGPNTGGMGAFSPVSWDSDYTVDDLMDKFVHPVLKGMAEEGRPFKGILFCGLMLTEDGWYLLEYNVRLGDPETQVIIPRLETDLMELFMAAVDGKLDEVEIKWKDDAAVCIVMANYGYPKSYETDSIIRGLNDEIVNSQRLLFHAGTKKEGDDIIAVGGRVLNVVGMAPTIREARSKALLGIAKIDWPQGFCRLDIAKGK